MMRKVEPRLKALFATGFVSPEIEAELTKGGIGGIVMKPYELDKVLEKISEILQTSLSLTENDSSAAKFSHA